MTNRSKTLSILLTLTLVSGLFAAMPLTARAQTAKELVETIESYGYAGTGSLSAEATGESEITVSGIVNGIGHGLILDVDPDLTIIWRAVLRGSANSEGLLRVFGKGAIVIEDGAVENSDNIAISTDCDITINNGTITSKTTAIKAFGNVTINGGTVKGDMVSVAAGVSSGVTVNGGIVQAGEREYNSIIDGSFQVIGGNAIESGGNITINGGMVSAAGGSAIKSGGLLTLQSGGNYTEDGYETVFPRNNKVTVNGGTVSATTGIAILSTGINIEEITGTGANYGSRALETHYNDIIINGGTVSATNGTAISANFYVYSGTIHTSGGSVAVNGGAVFAYAGDLLGIDVESRSAVIYIPRYLGSIINGDGVVIAWNNENPRTVTYEYGAADHLQYDPADAVVQWARSGGNSGIEYHNSDNSGFIPVSDATVTGEPPDNNGGAHPFNDVSNDDWYNDAVQYVFEKGLMTGISSEQFDPDGMLTRGMIITLLYRYAGAQDVSAIDNPFSDVSENEWYTDAIKWAAHNSIVLGYGDGRFGTNDPVTKEQLAVLIYRAQQSSGEIPQGVLAGYEPTDSDMISEYARDPVSVLGAQGLFADIPGSSFNPQTPATRAEVASILYRYLTAIETD